MYLIKKYEEKQTVCYSSADVGPLSPDNFIKSLVGRLSQFSYLWRWNGEVTKLVVAFTECDGA